MIRIGKDNNMMWFLNQGMCRGVSVYKIQIDLERKEKMFTQWFRYHGRWTAGGGTDTSLPTILLL